MGRLPHRRQHAAVPQLGSGINDMRTAFKRWVRLLFSVGKKPENLPRRAYWVVQYVLPLYIAVSVVSLLLPFWSVWDGYSDIEYLTDID